MTTFANLGGLVTYRNHLTSIINGVSYRQAKRIDKETIKKMIDMVDAIDQGFMDILLSGDVGKMLKDLTNRPNEVSEPKVIPIAPIKVRRANKKQNVETVIIATDKVTLQKDGGPIVRSFHEQQSFVFDEDVGNSSHSK